MWIYISNYWLLATRNIKIDTEQQKKPAITSQHHFKNIIVHTKNLIAVREFWMKRKNHSPPMRRKKKSQLPYQNDKQYRNRNTNQHDTPSPCCSNSIFKTPL